VFPGSRRRDRTTLIEITAIPEIDGIAIVPDLKARFPDHDFYLENDANAAALGEYYFGEDKLPEDYIFVTLGTGIGGAAIIDKKVFKGGGGNAMEPGHVPSKNGKVLERNIGKKELLDLAHAMRAEYTGQTQLPSTTAPSQPPASLLLPRKVMSLPNRYFPKWVICLEKGLYP
jgi:glucokinase